MEKAGGEGKPSEWLSTHPSAATRQEQIEGWLPEVRQYLPAGNNAGAAPLPPIQ
jgi:hypothetical protein